MNVIGPHPSFPRGPRGNGLAVQADAMRGYTLPELLVAMAVLLVLVAVAAPSMTAGLDEARVRGAAHFVAGRFGLTRTQAVHRHANVGMRFTGIGSDIRLRPYLDTNGNGVRSAEVATGIDEPILPAEQLSALFSGVRFGFIDGATLIDGSPAGPDDEPVRFGVARMATFTPVGTATAGTVYIRGRERTQYAVVILGATGRTRIARFDPLRQVWTGQ
jgi:prepilin-type N-terminal cleavage/methylation domain-containing protein